MNTKPKLSEAEISRRLWRIYEMALAAAERRKCYTLADLGLVDGFAEMFRPERKPRNKP